MKSKYYFPHTATVFFLLTVAVALFSWIGSIYGLGKCFRVIFMLAEGRISASL